jgi:hypothetical protein
MLRAILLFATLVTLIATAGPGVITPFTYDVNGNMLTGLGAKVVEYERENRPLSVIFGYRSSLCQPNQ